MAKTRKSKFGNPWVAEKFQTYPKEIQKKLLELRTLILDVARQTPGVGKLEEDLKWGQPSFLTSETKSGSLVRIDSIGDSQFAVYFHCQTTLVRTFKRLYPKLFSFEGNRALVFHLKDKIPRKELRNCIALALTYRLRKKKK